MKKKILLASIVTLSLALLVAVGGSIAWLIAETNEVSNVFKPSNIDITLIETTTDYKMIPGNAIAKNPKVTVTADIPCYVFVKVDEVNATNYDFDAFLEYCIADGWKLYGGMDATTESGSAIDTVDKDSYVLYRTYTPGTDSVNSWNVLGCEKGSHTDGTTCNGCVVVKGEVTKQMMTAITGDVAQPTLKFDAAAVQMDNLTIAAAYEQAWNTTPTT